MLGNFLKKRVNKKRNVDVNNPTSSGGQGKYMKYVSLYGSALEAALSIPIVKGI